MIFSRNRGSSGRRGARDSGSAANGKGGRHARRRADEPTDHGDDDPSAAGAGAVDAGAAGAGVAAPAFGPYDIAHAPQDGRERLDLGALHVPAVAGVEIQMQAGPQGQIQQIQLVYGGSRLQLGAFAAPRTEGIWDEIRSIVRSSLAAAGARPHEIDGDYGLEVRARVKDSTGTTEVRHVGIDGPRWFVHGVYMGAAAEPDRAGPLRDALRGLIVDRGTEARPVREALPLRLPPQAANRLGDASGEPMDSQGT